MDTVRVVIADDHRVVTEGLRAYLNGQAGLEVVGTTASGQQAVNLCRTLKPDVILADIYMSDADGFEVLASIKASCPRTVILVLTSSLSAYDLSRTVSLGAAGYISKQKDPSHLSHAIRAAVAGEAIIDRSLLRSTLEVAEDQPATTPEKSRAQRPALTDQERRVLQLVAQGLDNESIASALSVTRNTIKTHNRNIYSKLGVSDRTQAAIWALRSGFVS